MKKNTVVEIETTSECLMTGEEASIQSIECVVESLGTDTASGITAVSYTHLDAPSDCSSLPVIMSG